MHSAEYQNYLISRDCKPGKVKKQFSDTKKRTREEAKKTQNYLRPIFLLHAISLHNITVCCLTLKHH